MKKIIYLVSGLILGAVLTGIIAWNSMPGLMMIKHESKFDFQTTVDKLEIAAYDNGWEVVNVIDIQERLISSSYNDMLRMQIIEICHAEHSYTILQDDENKFVAGIMPCRFAVYETYEGKVMISKMNIGLLSQMFGGLIQQVMGGVANEEKLMLQEIVK